TTRRRRADNRPAGRPARATDRQAEAGSRAGRQPIASPPRSSRGRWRRRQRADPKGLGRRAIQTPVDKRDGADQRVGKIREGNRKEDAGGPPATIGGK